MNVSDFDYKGFNGTINLNPVSCQVGVNSFDKDCIYNLICGQMNAYFVKTGAIIIISYIAVSWLKWWFFKYGTKYIDYGYVKNPFWGKFWGDFREHQTKVYWNDWVQVRFLKVMILFIVVVIYYGIVGRLS